ncbi:MAG: FAD-binding domain-containing protein [Beijerinckiaceae bacterium]
MNPIVLLSQTFEPTRAAALARLEAFVPSAGNHYAARRNADLGSDKRGNVSMLSPYIRHRLITEEEVLQAVLSQHSLEAAEKYVQEVFWRTYFKGHLETRPVIWERYREALDQQVMAVQQKGGIRKAYEQAVSGRTGIDCFDAWVEELTTTGYLHNHARMWFASIWIFTLRLPWELGADFMLRHLLDGDPASNTLSWRWVGGLHTKGKTYLARRDNIIANTGGRFAPKGLANDAPPLEEPALPSAGKLPAADSAFPDGRVGLLITEEDLHPASLAHGAATIAAIAGASAVADLSPLPVDDAVHAFTTAALDDALLSASQAFCVASTVLPSLSVVTLEDWARKHALDTIVTAYAPVGTVAMALAQIAPKLATKGIRLVQVRRRFDTMAWPHGTRGFFAMKEKIPELLLDLQIGTSGTDEQLALFVS